jgi:hypothetical protein
MLARFRSRCTVAQAFSPQVRRLGPCGLKVRVTYPAAQPYTDAETVLATKHGQPPEVPRCLTGVALEKGTEMGHIRKAQAIGDF